MARQVDTQPGADASGLRERIVQQALEILPAGGVDGVTMRALARRLGYSPASLYLHFASKAELLREVARVGTARLQGRLDDAARAGDPESVLAATARAYLAFGLEAPHLYRVMFDASSQAPPLSRLFAHCRLALVRGMAEGRFRRQEPDAALVPFAAALHGAVQMALLAGPGPDARTLAEWLVGDRLAAVRASARAA